MHARLSCHPRPPLLLQCPVSVLLTGEKIIIESVMKPFMGRKRLGFVILVPESRRLEHEPRSSLTRLSLPLSLCRAHKLYKVEPVRAPAFSFLAHNQLPPTCAGADAGAASLMV